MLALVIIILASWSSNDNNLYSGALSLTAVFRNVSKNSIVLAVALLGYISSAINITNYFVAFLVFLSAIVPPIAAVYTVDFLLTKNNNTCHKNVNWRAIGAWGIGVLFAVLTTPKGTYGLGYMSITSIPALDGYILAGLSYYCLSIKYKKD